MHTYLVLTLLRKVHLFPKWQLKKPISPFFFNIVWGKGLHQFGYWMHPILERRLKGCLLTGLSRKLSYHIHRLVKYSLLALALCNTKFSLATDVLWNWILFSATCAFKPATTSVRLQELLWKCRKNVVLPLTKNFQPWHFFH